MPADILQSLIRTYFLEEGIKSFFDKVIPTLRPNMDLIQYDGNIRVGMFFKRVEFRGPASMNKYEDVRITNIRMGSEGPAVDFSCKRVPPHPYKRDMRTTSAGYVHFLTFYV